MGTNEGAVMSGEVAWEGEINGGVSEWKVDVFRNLWTISFPNNSVMVLQSSVFH